MPDENVNFELHDGEDATPNMPPPGPKPSAPPPGANGGAADIDPLSYHLTKPIQAHGQDVTVLRWREPTAGDIERAGNPINIDLFSEQPRLTFDERKMNNMISLLAQIPPSSVKMLSGSDWNTIAWKMVRFFMPVLGG